MQEHTQNLLSVSLFFLIALFAPDTACAALPVPAASQSIPYDCTVAPVISSVPQDSRPIGVGNVAHGGNSLTLQVTLDLPSNPVDIYLALLVPAIAADTLFVFTPGNDLQPHSAGIVPWRTNVAGFFDQQLLTDLPVALLPPAIYHFFLVVTPAGSPGNYYLWRTRFSTDYAGFNLEVVTPESVGWSSEKLAEASAMAAAIGSAAVVALYDGKLFYSWGDIRRNYWCHSIRKPFLSALYGIHVEQGAIDLDATLADLSIDDIPPVLTPEEKQAQVRHLLQARSGVYHEAAYEAQIMIDTRPPRGSHPPGTFFYYNNWDFNTLGTIFAQRTGTGIFEEFRRAIADPIGMEDFAVESCMYQYEPEKSMHPAYKFRMSAKDMARFGLLYQKNGVWKNRRVVPSQWIEESTRAYSIEDPVMGMGYGYMWNVALSEGEVARQVGAPFYWHSGIGIHMLVVVPDMKLVLVHRFDTDGDYVKPDGESITQLLELIAHARLPR